MRTTNPGKASVFGSWHVLLLLGVYFAVATTHLFFVPNAHARAGHHNPNSIFKRKSENHTTVSLTEKYTVNNKKTFKEFKKIYKNSAMPPVFKTGNLRLYTLIGPWSVRHLPDQRYCYLSNRIIRV